MGEHIFRVLLAELGIVRITCRRCQGVAEVPVGKIAALMKGGRCPLCQHDICDPPDLLDKTLTHLHEAMRGFELLSNKLGIEFPIKLDGRQSESGK